MKNREPRYKEIVRFIETGIMNGDYPLSEKIPSVNALKIQTGYSRSTILLAMEELKSRGIIQARMGSGYYVSSTRVEVREKILMLFNEFNAFKEDLYNSFVKEMGDDASIDIVFHNFNRRVFETLLEDARGKYTSYVVMPGKFTGLSPLLESLDGNVYLLDHFASDIKGRFPSVGQDFCEDTYDALYAGLEKVRKYDTIVLIQYGERAPSERYDGVCRFCEDFSFHPYLRKSMDGERVRKGELYITADDRELVYILKTAAAQGLEIGKDFGLISYDDTILKEVLSGGIATISTDFKQMGRTLASMMRDKTMRTVRNPWHLSARHSL